MVDLILPAGVVLAVDQVTKALALRTLADGKLRPIAMGSPVGLRLCLNTRVRPAFLGRRSTLICLWVFAVLGTVLASCCPGFEGPVVHGGLGAAIGGAAGNLIDRIWRGAVVDFIDLSIWPVFNVADLAIVFGIGGALLRALIVV